MPIFLGLVYYAAIFSLAFALGIFRTVLVAPVVGLTAAVCLEIPVVLLVSWATARRLLRHRTFALPQRLMMGATAFAATLFSEAIFAHILRGQSVAGWADTLMSPLGLVGLAAQVTFAAMPAMMRAPGRAVAPPLDGSL